MTIIALDQSTTATGLSVFENGELVNYYLIKPKKKKRIDEVSYVYDKTKRTLFIDMPEWKYEITLLRTTLITDIIEKELRKIAPDVVYFEEIFENGNPKGYKSLGRLQGFIAHLCHTLNIPYKIIEESKWINTWGTYDRTIKRPERKKDIMKKVNDYYGLDITVDDLSDSIALGRYATEIEKEN